MAVTGPYMLLARKELEVEEWRLALGEAFLLGKPKAVPCILLIPLLIHLIAFGDTASVYNLHLSEGKVIHIASKVLENNRVISFATPEFAM